MATATTIQAYPHPLRVDEHSVIRVGNSQVLLDVVIHAFHNGAEPEAIAHAFPTLELADVCGAIAYYLRHRPLIDSYLHKRRQDAENLRTEIVACQPCRVDLRSRLMARKAQMDLADASTSDSPTA